MECRRDDADKPEIAREPMKRPGCVASQLCKGPKGINLARPSDVGKARQPQVRGGAVLISITAMKLIPASETIAFRIIPCSRHLSRECKILV